MHTRIPFRKGGINHCTGLKLFYYISRRINIYGDLTLLPGGIYLFFTAGLYRPDSFYHRLMVNYCLGKGNGSANNKRLRYFKDKNFKPASVEPVNDTGGKITAAANDNDAFFDVEHMF